MRIKAIIISCIYFYSCVSDYDKALTGEYHYIEEGSHQYAIWHMGKEFEKFIPCEILSYDYNEEFIIAAQRPVNPCFIGFLTDSIQYPASEDSIYYWIADNKNDKLYGPLNKENFDDIKNNIGVPPSLKIDLPKKQK